MLRKLMYLVTTVPHSNDTRCAYYCDNNYRVYQVYRDCRKHTDELLFESPEAALDILLKLRKEEKCRLIN